MSDSDEASDGGGWRAPSWLGMASPRALLDRTTKFVLNAAHGKNRSLLPTSDNSLTTTRFDGTGIDGWDDNESGSGDGSDDDEGHRTAAPPVVTGAEGCVWHRAGRDTALVLERDVLMGRWNAYELDESHTAEPAEDPRPRSATPPGMLRLRLDRQPARRRQQPARRRTPSTRASVGSEQPAGRQAKIRFMLLPARVIAQILEHLPVEALLDLANSCRVVRRVMHVHEPGGGGGGDAEYTAAGQRVWRALLRRMGWRAWQERARGSERRARVAVPRSHARLVRRLCGVDGEPELAGVVAAAPDLLFKAIYADLRADFASGGPAADASQAAGDVGERLDQLLWFGRGRLTRGADVASRRVAGAADRFEAAHSAQFARMFARGDCAGMQRAARVLEHIRDGRACIDVLAAAHPLVGSAREMPARYARVADAGARVTDSQSLGAFLDALHAVIGEHARVAALALPPPALPASALLGFVRALFAPRGLALRTLQQLYAHLRAVPVVAHVTQAAAVRSAVVAPDAAAKDVLFLETVAGAVAQLLAAARAWAAMRPVAVDAALGRRCVFAAFDDVIADYVQLERRVLGRAYAAALAQWTAATPPPPVGSSRSAPRAASFQQRLHAIEELKQRVLRVAEGAEKRGAAEDVLPHAPLSIDLCVDLLLANRDAVARLAVFAAAPPDMALRRLALDAIEAVFCALLQSVGNYIRPAFTGVVADLKQLEQAAVSSAGPVAADSGPAVYSPQSLQAEKELREKVAAVELRFVEVIHLTDLAVQLLEIYYKKDMGAFIKETDFLNICNQEKRALERAVDDSVAVGMDSVIEIVLRQTRHILDSEQRAADYHPDSGTSLALTPTLACVRAVQFLGESGAALQCMTAHKQMRDVFMGELGVRLFSVLLDNIKRFQITEPGGFQLIADLNLYYDWAATAAVDADTLRFFAALKDLANCFILAPKDLRAFLRDQYSRRTFDGVMRSEEVYDVVACRADYRAIRTQVEGHCDFM